MQKMIFSLLVFSLLSMTSLLHAQERIEWLTWEEAIELSKNEKRKVFVDVYTDWCGYCKKMDAATFKNSEIASYLNENYYPVKFNAEQREDIRFKDKVYKFVNSGRRGYHQLALEITLGRLSYPTIVFLDENFNVIQPIPGFKEPDSFEKIMRYFGEDHHKSTPWKQYLEEYVDN